MSVVVVVVVVVGTKIARSRVLGICACYKHNQSVDIGENWFVRASNCSKRLTSATNRAFSVQHACGLSTTHTPLASAAATAHAQAQCWKRSSNHKTALKQSVAISGYRTRGVCALQSSSFLVENIDQVLWLMLIVKMLSRAYRHTPKEKKVYM